MLCFALLCFALLGEERRGEGMGMGIGWCGLGMVGMVGMVWVYFVYASGMVKYISYTYIFVYIYSSLYFRRR